MAARDILLVWEAGKGQTEPINARLLATGEALSRQWGGRLAALLTGHGIQGPAADLSRFVDELHVADDARYGNYNPELFVEIAEGLVRAMRPGLVLLGHTYIGMDLAPRLAARLGAGFAGNCSEVTLEGGALCCVRPMYQGRVQAKLALNGAAAIATLQLGSADFPPATRAGRVQRIDPAPAADLRIVALRMLAPAREAVDIAKAEVVVAGGRGIGAQENYRLVQDLAEALGGVPACSRPLVDMGWLGPGFQVGLSGKAIKPKLYVACGISGAIEHVAGMRDAQTIVAINNDPDAPIFTVAHYGIVGDLNDVIPAMIAEVRAARGAK